MRSLPSPIRITIAALAIALTAAACGSDGDSSGENASPTTAAPNAATEPATGVRVVSATEAGALASDPAPGQVVLDVRTPEEFAAGHLEDAELLDFYRDDFADQLAALDKDVPYLIYCRSGNRSSQAREMMAELGFGDVADIDGGITGWIGADLPVVTG